VATGRVAHSSPGSPDGAVFADWGGSRFWFEWATARGRGPFGALSASCPRGLDWFPRRRCGLVFFLFFFGRVFFFVFLVPVFFVFLVPVFFGLRECCCQQG
jgi:hypothetical protein